ncbi:hypothetical protein TEK04_19125 [Klenkia sp. LSe6-5]|uniref:Uncharacterized protein n=1 Tax=Klenkia sesuvii TaxID=3103137 RepID=A0ABU8DYC2_9ACTN
MDTGWWAVVFFAAVAVLAAVWIGNTLRWTRAQGNLARRGRKGVRPASGGRHGLRLVAAVVLTAIAVVGLVWSILYAVAN